ncbi:coenzyme F420-0:L-glutamate ligase [Aromatoleum toluclasticum]|uniref:coenzyme F420-0:L-glutamate ligase n=1 Tax=Aromatoleum toluclasticum TaxID=92003 RepID=UPI001D181922|nr:coenzyme F420-0:L-glutamate ligase [Aromatoleum toluclasticum]MCC4114862.1 coenzyme F420-0:L-glutamate ligase [Aromatoleum toluclasticum]
MSARMELTGLPGFPLVEPGDDLVPMILDALARAQIVPADGDLLVLAQKVVSKAENRYAYLDDIEPSAEAQALAEQADKDPRIVELMLQESVEVMRHRRGAVIVRHRRGYVHANAGIDQSNIRSDPQRPRVLLLPIDPDRSAAQLRERLRAATGAELCIIINDSAGRPWRDGTAGFAIGTAGFEPVVDMIGESDLFGRALQITKVAVADELAAAASFVMGQAAEAIPVVHVRGAQLRPSTAGSASLIRPRAEDLFA